MVEREVQFCIEMPVLRDLLSRAFGEEIPQCTGTKEEAPKSHADDPQVEETWCQVPTEVADGPPTLWITTKRMILKQVW